MKSKLLLNLILGAFCVLSSCSTQQYKNGYNGVLRAKRATVDKITVRLTTYWKNGKGSDKWTRKLQSSTGVKLVDKKVAAVDPKVIPYYKTIRLNTNPPLCLRAVDTGTDVIKRTASRKTGKNHPVVDIFFENKGEALAFASRNPYIINAEIYYLSLY